MFKLILLVIMTLGYASNGQAQSWSAIKSCKQGAVVIDQAHVKDEDGRLKLIYQIVIRDATDISYFKSLGLFRGLSTFSKNLNKNHQGQEEIIFGTYKPGSSSFSEVAREPVRTGFKDVYLMMSSEDLGGELNINFYEIFREGDFERRRLVGKRTFDSCK